MVPVETSLFRTCMSTFVCPQKTVVFSIPKDVTVTNDALGIRNWPRWKQIALSILMFAVGMAAIDYVKTSFLRGSPEAKAIKGKMEVLAEQLVKAEKLGDQPTALALAEPTVKIVNDYNALDDARKAEINKTSLRYCVLAAVHLSSGPVEISQTGSWASKSKYNAALDECK